MFNVLKCRRYGTEKGIVPTKKKTFRNVRGKIGVEKE